jgi:hypothetical protein
MTSAGEAIINELKRISGSEDAAMGDGAEAKVTFGLEPWSDADMQQFIAAGFEFAEKGFKEKMAAALGWIHLGYLAAQREVKGGVM